MARKIFLISPVRVFLLPDGRPKPDALLTPEEKRKKSAIASYVANFETEGCEVYWPYRDTPQTDLRGWDICSKNFAAILWADEIHVWFAPDSEGLKFDLGMVFALFRIGFLKKIVIANPEAVSPLSRKGLEDVLLKMQEEAAKICASHLEPRVSGTAVST